MFCQRSRELPLYTIPSTDSRKDAWKVLSLLSSAHNVQKLLCGETWSERSPWSRTDERIQQKAAQIAACVLHAREYFQASETVTLNTSPLLLYYGALSLAKAVILSNDLNSSLTSFKHHGLSLVFSSVCENSSDVSIDEASAKVKRGGVFRLLCKSIDSPCIQKTEYNLRNIFKVTPDLRNMYMRYYNEYSHVIPVEHLYYEPDYAGFSLAVSTIAECFESVFPEIAECTTRVGLDNAPLYTSDKLTKPIDEFFNFVRSSNGSHSEMIRPLENGVYKPFATMFLGLFILGSLVRYNPDVWIEEIVYDRCGLRPVIEVYSQICATWLPIEVLREIHRVEYVFHPPGVSVFGDPLSIMNRAMY